VEAKHSVLQPGGLDVRFAGTVGTVAVVIRSSVALYQKAGAKAGIGRLGTNALRHTYRSWLDAVGTPIAVQQKLMRHADIRTTMNVYGDVVTDEMAHAASKVAGLALSGR
jgi:integrase